MLLGFGSTSLLELKNKMAARDSRGSRTAKKDELFDCKIRLGQPAGFVLAEVPVVVSTLLLEDAEFGTSGGTTHHMTIASRTYVDRSAKLFIANAGHHPLRARCSLPW